MQQCTTHKQPMQHFSFFKVMQTPVLVCRGQLPRLLMQRLSIMQQAMGSQVRCMSAHNH